MTIRYEDAVQDALRGVVKTVLEDVQQNGLLGNHHLYITFKTNYPGVELADYLRKRHPEEVTIVLQYQFWDLIVTNEGFSISLSFNDVRENLVVPYESITAFVDPSVKFGLHFTPKELSDIEDSKNKPSCNKNQHSEKNSVLQDKEGTTQKTQEKELLEEKIESGKVVSMDAFRKKAKDL